MKKRICLALLATLAVLLLVGAVPSAPSSYISDMAGVLTAAQENGMAAASAALESESGAQIAVLTVTDLGGARIEEYANDVFNDWGIGDAKKDNGVLILLSVGDRKVHIEVGQGLEGDLTDGRTGRLLDEYAIPYYQNDDFANGTEQVFFALINAVRTAYGLEAVAAPDPNDENREAQEYVPEEESDYIVTIIMLIVFLVIFFLTGGPRRRGIIFWGGFGGPGGFGGGRSGGGGFGGFGGGSSGGGGAGRSF